jgi:hypothetical protein
VYSERKVRNAFKLDPPAVSGAAPDVSSIAGNMRVSKRWLGANGDLGIVWRYHCRKWGEVSVIGETVRGCGDLISPNLGKEFCWLEDPFAPGGSGLREHRGMMVPPLSRSSSLQGEVTSGWTFFPDPGGAVSPPMGGHSIAIL